MTQQENPPRLGKQPAQYAVVFADQSPLQFHVKAGTPAILLYNDTPAAIIRFNAHPDGILLSHGNYVICLCAQEMQNFLRFPGLTVYHDTPRNVLHQEFTYPLEEERYSIVRRVPANATNLTARGSAPHMLFYALRPGNPRKIPLVARHPDLLGSNNEPKRVVSCVCQANRSFTLFSPE